MFIVIAAVGLVADLVTKSAIFARFYDAAHPEVVHWGIDGILGIQTSFNGGALFGIFQGGSWWLAGLSLIALSGIVVWLFVWKMATSLYLTIALAMITGGILGNLYDRLGFGYTIEYARLHMYHVRDWIHFRLQGIPLFDPWPNFNIADSLLVTGAALLFCYAIFVPQPVADEPDGEATSSAGDAAGSTDAANSGADAGGGG